MREPKEDLSIGSSPGKEQSDHRSATKVNFSQVDRFDPRRLYVHSTNTLTDGRGGEGRGKAMDLTSHTIMLDLT